jgi:hypothetical protein
MVVTAGLLNRLPASAEKMHLWKAVACYAKAKADVAQYHSQNPNESLLLSVREGFPT